MSWDSQIHLEHAANNHIESALLAKIVVDYGNKSAFSEYALWLADHSKAKANYVNELTEAFFEKQKIESFPHTQSFPASWCALLGSQLLRGILENELESMAR